MWQNLGSQNHNYDRLTQYLNECVRHVLMHCHDFPLRYHKKDNNISLFPHPTMPASAPTSQGGMKCLMGGCLGVDEDVVEEMEAVDGVGELVLNFLKVGSSSWGVSQYQVVLPMNLRSG